MNKVVLSLFLIGHFLGDFYFQSDSLARGKKNKMGVVVTHSFIYFITLALVSLPLLGFGFLKWVTLIALVHFIVDGLKFYFIESPKKNSQHKIRIYLLDQSIHIATILLVTLAIAFTRDTVEYTKWFRTFTDILTLDVEFIVSWILATLIIIKPLSITIRKVLYQYQPKAFDKEEMGHPGAGSLIGILERSIVLILLSQNQYGAIGFVLTAKSIARYNKIIEVPEFAEYYLLGTLLSMLLVIVTHVLIIL